MARRLVSLLVALVTVTGTTTAVAASAQQHTNEVLDGPDVSSYQHPYGAKINWHQVARQDKDFAIVKATEGRWYKNPWFHRDYNGARDAGLVRGSYHFAEPAYPIASTARRQAQFYVQHLGNVRTRSTLPPALDLESTGGLTRGALVTWAQTFLLQVRRLTGRTPMIYTYPTFWAGVLHDPAALARYPLWMAAYHGMQPDPTATLWQYTSGAYVDGIHGRVDMSRFLGAPDLWSQLRDGTQSTPWPASAPGSPVNVFATPGDGRLAVGWLPGDTGSGAVDQYRVTVTPADGSSSSVSYVNGVTTQAVVTGLTNGTSYTVTVAARNGQGYGDDSPSSYPVTPMIPTSLAIGGPPETTYGDDARVAVRLLRPDWDKGLAARELTVESQVDDGTDAGWAPYNTVTTNDDGWVVLHPRQLLHNTDLRFTYAGTGGSRSASLVVHVLVRNQIYAHLSRTAAHAGRPVTLHGSIRPAVEGIKVWTQSYYDGAWHDAGAVTTGPGGTYSFTWTPKDRGKHVIRTTVSWFDGRARGFSATQRLVVK